MISEKRTNLSAYKQLSEILNDVKIGKITPNQAMQKIQLKESIKDKPYCKMTKNGTMELHNVTKDPIVYSLSEWETLSKIIKSNYVDNFINNYKTHVKESTEFTPSPVPYKQQQLYFPPMHLSPYIHTPPPPSSHGIFSNGVFYPAEK